MIEQIQIREDYTEYLPAIDIPSVVRRLLAATPTQHLTGLDSIVLRNVGRLHPKKRRFRFQGKKVNMIQCGGFYHSKTRRSPAWIELYPDNIFSPSMPKWIQFIPFIQDIFVGHALFHEIGHHIDHATGREQDREAAAEKWRKKLMRGYVKSNYRYLWPFRKVLLVLLRSVIWFLRTFRRMRS